MRCSDANGKATLYPSYTAAWAAKSKSCDGQPYGSLSEQQRRALHVAYNTNVDNSGSKLRTLYGMCAENDVNAWSDYLPTATHEQSFEVQGMLTLCPEHPLAGELKAMLAQAETYRTQEAQGKVFGAGVFKVGSEIQAGTYVASSGQGCYWERQDSNGGIIANGFHENSARVQVTIRSSDYAFMSRGCGQWKPAS